MIHMPPPPPSVERALAPPRLEPLHRLGHVLGRASERETHGRVTALAIEIDAGCRCDSGLAEHATAELDTVVGEARDIRVDVEGAIRGNQLVESRARQVIQQELSI